MLNLKSKKCYNKKQAQKVRIMFKAINFLFLIIFLSIFPHSILMAQKLQNISIKTSVIFNTLCAKCHEGECSGRLSFDTGSKAANSHIKRYSGDINISVDERKEFFSLLNYMKKECALYMPDTKEWKIKNLSQFALPSHKSYFIPLGTLKSGKYNFDIKTKEKIHFRVEIISEHFDPFLDQSICPDQRWETIQFSIDRSSNSFLRIRSKKPFHILTLEIIKDVKTY
jgi:hypothetical protein